ncbi:helix-turn-helix protein [Herbihabitans rhizosphaerae]|uniref:Helix-turn-helix protein n=1 Tax=Herbihabitans rhizosphaerae TaxID=1872711 RepID=A0A4Q7KEG3_9PSEU|nr:helix-turn-helix transcriptional regulator [Herbihabitans rhizosphaerae]RZS29610.1 helix-turn-helix protein [Herbihabitans rhizosphaerae]
MTTRQSPALYRRRLGRILEDYRVRQNLDPEDVVDDLYTTVSTLSRLENGKVRCSPHMLKSMLDRYMVPCDEWPPLIEMAAATCQKGWWHDYGITSVGAYVNFETEAEETFDFALALIPGILQIGDYTRALVMRRYAGRRDAKKVADRAATLRGARQERLDGENPLRLKVVFDETVLTRPRGGRDVLRRQLQHLITMSEKPNIAIQVIPIDVDHDGVEGSFSILRFPRYLGESDIVYHEYPFNEQFLDKPMQVSQYTRRFEELRSDALNEEDSRELIQRHMECAEVRRTG